VFADVDTPLGVLIDRQIAETGPMSFALYMQLCLIHPQYGYYHRPAPIGRSGDFITAPEISQVFGEAIGVWVALLSRQISGNRFDLVELGPGRGTLMNDLWRSLMRVAPEARPQGPFLVEIGESLRAEQAQRLSQLAPKWLASVADLPDDGPPLIVIANEFFDALPVRQYQKGATGWHERVVGLRDGRRAWGLNPTPIPDTALPAVLGTAEINARFETRPAADALMSELSAKLARRGGALLVIDYGYATSQSGDTIQAIAGHRFADPLARPGEADLTAHVDFEALALSAGRLRACPVLTQGAFLAALGSAERAAALMAANPARAEAIAANLARLTDPDQMGEIFKALCVCSREFSPYPFL
jgi:SAM-dependent MidA family methyltransferase